MSVSDMFPPGMPRMEASRSLLLTMGMTGRMLRAGFQGYIGISEVRLHLLAHLFGGQEVSQADLQRRLRVHGAAITRQVKQMESEGLLARRPDPNDNRFTLVNLTPAGVELARGLAARAKEFEQQVLQGISPEDTASAARVLNQMRENLAQMGATAGCPGEAEEDLPE
jgi:DNA-binding MarR family transcriptional regulator